MNASRSEFTGGQTASQVLEQLFPRLTAESLTIEEHIYQIVKSAFKRQITRGEE